VDSYCSLKEQYPDIVLTIAGSGPDEKALREYVKNKKVSNISLPGYI
jgi:glycosyltransferase involved in cell wall biosynthesis